MNKDKKTITDEAVGDFENSWTMENAMYVLQHPTVDAKIWAEAVEWLLLYGPEDIQKMLRSASMYATTIHFPDLKPGGCTAEGELCYNLEDIARALGIDREQALKVLKEKEKSHGLRHGYDDDEIYTVQ